MYKVITKRQLLKNWRTPDGQALNERIIFFKNQKVSNTEVKRFLSSYKLASIRSIIFILFLHPKFYFLSWSYKGIVRNFNSQVTKSLPFMNLTPLKLIPLYLWIPVTSKSVGSILHFSKICGIRGTREIFIPTIGLKILPL